MRIAKTELIDVKGIITKDNGREITNKDHNFLFEGIMGFLEKNGFSFAGGFACLDVKEYDKTIQKAKWYRRND